jgi:hypothetical protein
MKPAAATVSLIVAAISLAVASLPSKARADLLDFVARPGAQPSQSITLAADEAGIQSMGAGRSAAALAANGVDGSWKEFNLLQVAHAIAVHDAAHDRLLSLGGTRPSNWALSLSGPPAWQPLSEVPKPAFVHSDWTAYARSTGLLYYVQFSSGSFEIRTLDPLTGAGATLTPSGSAPGAGPAALVFDDADSRLLVLRLTDPSYSEPLEVWSLDFLPAPTWSKWTPSGTPPPFASRCRARSPNPALFPCRLPSS